MGLHSLVSYAKIYLMQNDTPSSSPLPEDFDIFEDFHRAYMSGALAKGAPDLDSVVWDEEPELLLRRTRPVSPDSPFK